MKATWRWGKIHVILSLEEATALLQQQKVKPDNQILEFLLSQINARVMQL